MTAGVLQREELLQRLLYAQHLTSPAGRREVCRDMNGLQAQYLSCARHALQIRCGEPLPVDWGIGLLKSWTIRGTIHIFPEDDLPLFLHAGREHFLRPEDRWVDDACMTAGRKRFFAGEMLSWLKEGSMTREELKDRCLDLGMTEEESRSVFNAWGGTLRALAEEGQIAGCVQEQKAFRLCDPFTPMEKHAAELELAHRYFSHYGPATVRDAAYYFGVSQASVRQWMGELPLSVCHAEGKERYFIGEAPDLPDIPACIFLAGFDPLLLGYRKQESPVLPAQHLRGIFNLTGIVFPAVLLQGQVKGKWKLAGRRVTVTLFEEVSPQERRALCRTAEETFPAMKELQWE